MQQNHSYNNGQQVESDTVYKALSAIYAGIFLIDLTDDSYRTIQNVPYVEKMIAGVSSAQRALDLAVEQAVVSQVGVGTTFTVVLPFRRDADAGAQDDSRTDYKESLHGMTVLLVEDNALNLEITEYLLKHEGYQVRSAVNGQEAVQIFERSKPFYFDAVLMDVTMPVMDGYTATRQIRALDRPDAQKVQIVAMTANAFAEDVAKCKEAGMNAHLPKPFKAEQLVASIAACGN